MASPRSTGRPAVPVAPAQSSASSPPTPATASSHASASVQHSLDVDEDRTRHVRVPSTVDEQGPTPHVASPPSFAPTSIQDTALRSLGAVSPEERANAFSRHHRNLSRSATDLRSFPTACTSADSTPLSQASSPGAFYLGRPPSFHAAPSLSSSQHLPYPPQEQYYHAPVTLGAPPVRHKQDHKAASSSSSAKNGSARRSHVVQSHASVGRTRSDPDQRHSLKSRRHSKQRKTWRSRLTRALLTFRGKLRDMTSSLASAYHVYTDSTVWILGRPYEITPAELVSGGHRQTVAVRRRRIQFVIEDFHSRLWMTYRKNFPPIAGSAYTSDAGWGCMLRSGQMMLAQAFMCHYVGRDWRYQPKYKDPNGTMHRQIVRWFVDQPNMKCPYSLHNMLREGQRMYKKSIGEWFGPGATCHMLKKCHGKHTLCDDVVLVLADDGILYRDKVEEAWPAARDDHKADVASTSSTDSSSSSSGRSGDSGDKEPALVVLIGVRLGVKSINPAYFPGLQKCFTIPYSLGFMGGKNSSSLYFVGVQDHNVMFLDPHTVQPTPAVNAPNLTRSYHTPVVRSIPLGDVDPSLALGFYCRNRAEFDDFWHQCQMMSDQMKFPPFTLAAQAPDYGADDFSFDMDHETVTSNASGSSDSKTAPVANGPSTPVARQNSSSLQLASGVGTALAHDSMSQLGPSMDDNDSDDGFVLL